jgi:hypothetical protein
MNVPVYVPIASIPRYIYIHTNTHACTHTYNDYRRRSVKEKGSRNEESER